MKCKHHVPWPFCDICAASAASDAFEKGYVEPENTLIGADCIQQVNDSRGIKDATIDEGDPWITVEYAAGFIDADGCITCSKNNSGNPDWSVMAVQSEANGIGPLIAMQNRWGGSVCKSASAGPRKNNPTLRSDMYKWSVRGTEAAIALSDLYPFLVIKQQKAQEALEYFASHPKISRILLRLAEPVR